VGVIEPTSFEDVRNLFLYRGRATARRGLTMRATLQDAAAAALNQTILLHPARQESVAIGVGYKTADRTVHVNRLTNAGVFASYVGQWFTNDAGAPNPKALAADSYGRVFLAHDQPSYGLRKQTVYYDPNAAPQIQDLTADLDRDGTKVVMKFRGVQRYLNYIVGWGYGTEADQNRAEIVRICQPGDPLSWHPDHYFILGQRNEPVTTCQPSLSSLMGFKETETHEIYGYDRRTFGTKPIDHHFGCGNGRLAVSLNGVVYFWSLPGPRVIVSGTASRDLAIPLGLDQPAPSDLATEGALTDAFAVYDPGSKALLFVFGARGYVLHLRNPERPEWSYFEFGNGSPKVLNCGGVFYATTGSGAVAGAPTGQGVFVSAVSTTDSGLTVVWTNSGAVGAETVEVWARNLDTAGAWSQLGSVGVSGASQSLALSGLAPLSDYEVALRYRLNGLYRADFNNADPGTWPANAKGTGTVKGEEPTAFTQTWSRTGAAAEKIQLGWTNTYTTAGIDIEVYRNGVLLATVVNNGLGAQTYDDTTVAGETNYQYSLRYKRYVNNFSDSTATVTRWAGPNAPIEPKSLTSTLGSTYQATWALGKAAAITEVWDDYPSGYALRFTTAAGETARIETIAGSGGSTVRVKVRHKETAFTTTDYSEFLELGFVEILGGGI
jgi:hypothetical protein